jgi:hypothetical protein
MENSSDFFFGKKDGKISHCGMREGAMGGRVTIAFSINLTLV